MKKHRFSDITTQPESGSLIASMKSIRAGLGVPTFIYQNQTTIKHKNPDPA
jgi:hypothetical protein